MKDGKKMNQKCSMCDRETNDLEFHHFEPGKKRRKTNEGIEVCHQCGDQLHLLFSNNELRNDLNSLEKILSNEKILSYISWVKNKPVEKHFSVQKKKKK